MKNHDEILKHQVGGTHYEVRIQPAVYNHANGLGFIEGSVVKYITRWRNKDGIQDLEKIKHYVDLLIVLEKLATQQKVVETEIRVVLTKIRDDVAGRDDSEAQEWLDICSDIETYLPNLILV